MQKAQNCILESKILLTLDENMTYFPEKNHTHGYYA